MDSTQCARRGAAAFNNTGSWPSTQTLPGLRSVLADSSPVVDGDVHGVDLPMDLLSVGPGSHDDLKPQQVGGEQVRPGPDAVRGAVGQHADDEGFDLLAHGASIGGG